MQSPDSSQQIMDAYLVEKYSFGFKFDKTAQVLRQVVSLQMKLDQ